LRPRAAAFGCIVAAGGGDGGCGSGAAGGGGGGGGSGAGGDAGGGGTGEAGAGASAIGALDAQPIDRGRGLGGLKAKTHERHGLSSEARTRRLDRALERAGPYKKLNKRGGTALANRSLVTLVILFHRKEARTLFP